MAIGSEDKVLSQGSPQQQRKIVKLTVAVIRQMLTLATTMKIQTYLLDKTAAAFRDFESEIAELEGRNTIHGTGIVAVRAEMQIERPTYEQGFFYNDVPLGSYELGAYIDAFPLSAAAASYLFTLLEVFGDDVAEILNAGGIDTNKAWHEDVKGFADLRDKVQVGKMRQAFAKHFKASADDVPETAAHQIVRLKKQRNDFAHDGVLNSGFSNFLEDVLAVVCHIAFLTTSEDRISVYPWEDHMETFFPQTKA